MASWPPTPDARLLFRQWRVVGDGAAQGNLVAWEIGLRPIAGGWTLREIQHLQFLRHEVSIGRLRP